MSFSLPPVDLSTTVVGSPIPVPFIQLMSAGSPIADQGQGTPQMFLKNESGVGLDIVFPQSGLRFPLAAGAWTQPFPVSPNDSSFIATPTYILANAPVSKLLGAYFMPGEQPVFIQALGNSPIGLSQSVSSLTTKIPINTTSGNVVGIEFGPDVATVGDDWEFIVLTTSGNLILWDNKNARTAWQAQLSSGIMFFNQGISLPGNPTGMNIELIDMVDSSSGGHHYGLFMDQDHSLHLFDFTTSHDTALINANGHMVIGVGLSVGTSIFSIGGQATAGSFGVPMSVNQTIRQNVTSTAQQTFNYAVATSGLYRVSGSIAISGTAATAITVAAIATDPDNSQINGGNFLTVSAGVIVLNAASLVTPSAWQLLPQSLNAKAGTNISMTYRNNSGVPNDWVTFYVERLA